jgi:hypothetical protein
MCKNLANALIYEKLLKIDNPEFNLILTKSSLKIKLNKFFDFEKIFKLLNYFYIKYKFQIDRVSIDYFNFELELENETCPVSQEFLKDYENFISILEKVIMSDKYFYSGINLNNAEIIKIRIFFKKELEDGHEMLKENLADKFYVLSDLGFDLKKKFLKIV